MCPQGESEENDFQCFSDVLSHLEKRTEGKDSPFYQIGESENEMNKIVNKKLSREGKTTAKMDDARVAVSDYIVTLGIGMYVTKRQLYSATSHQ